MSSKLHRSPGQDGITAELIRAALLWLITWLIVLWEWSVVCAHVAQSWKDGIITTFFINLDPTRTINYRGATLLAVLGKCFVYILISRLIWALDAVLLEHQYGFRRKYSTNHAVLSILEEVRQQLDKKNFSCGVFVDLEKAFDTVNHKILIE